MVVNVSSVVGRVCPPLTGLYGASKYALEALSDALRMELAPWNVRVVLIEPGPVATGFVGASRLESEAVLARGRSAYVACYDRLLEGLEHQPGGTVSADDVARCILRAVRSRRPSARYPVHPLAWVLPTVRFLLPTSVGDWLFARRVGLLRRDLRLVGGPPSERPR